MKLGLQSFQHRNGHYRVSGHFTPKKILKTVIREHEFYFIQLLKYLQSFISDSGKAG